VDPIYSTHLALSFRNMLHIIMPLYGVVGCLGYDDTAIPSIDVDHALSSDLRKRWL
jgi:hypothetical protein